jgi:Putative beta-barrel porin 2
MNARPRLLVCAAGLLACGGALAQSTDRPWYVGLTQDFTHQSNVLGTSTGEISDTISTTSLRGGVNQTFGRQRLYADVSLSHARYADLSGRDHSGYTFGAGLDWATVERLSGSLTLNSQRRQTDFSVGGIVPVTVSNIERSDEVGFRARLGVVTRLSFEAGFGHRRVTFSAPEYADREYRQDNANAGVVYRPSDILSLSAGVSGAKTRFATAAAGQPAADRSRRQDVYASADWSPTGASTIAARLAVGKQEYDLGTAADFDGVTGSLIWNWRPGARLALATTLSRDIGQDSGFRRVEEGSPVTATDFARISNRIGVTARYELTAKINLTAGLGYSRRNLVDGFTGASGRDETNDFSVGARWAATRTLSFGCDASHESRRASGAGSSDLDNNRFGCFGSVTLD